MGQCLQAEALRANKGKCFGWTQILNPSEVNDLPKFFSLIFNTVIATGPETRVEKRERAIPVGVFLRLIFPMDLL